MSEQGLHVILPKVGEAEEAYAGDYEEAVTADQDHQKGVDAALHLRPAQDDDGEEVPYETQGPDQTEQHAVDKELKGQVEVPVAALFCRHAHCLVGSQRAVIVHSRHDD